MPSPDLSMLAVVLPTIISAANFVITLSIRLESSKLREYFTLMMSQHVEKFHATRGPR